MSDARWLDVDDDLIDAARHFANAQDLYSSSDFGKGGLEAYRDGMALMHALQAGHTSAESALLRILRILGERAPSGEDWHKKVIERLAKENGAAHARPALLTPVVAADLQETRRFRNRAMRNYGHFDPSRVAPSLEAAKRLVTSLRADVERFKAIIDTP